MARTPDGTQEEASSREVGKNIPSSAPRSHATYKNPLRFHSSRTTTAFSFFIAAELRPEQINMHLLVALISVLTLFPRSLLVNAKALDCYAFTAGVVNVIIMDSENGRRDCIGGCDFLKEKVAENRVGESCKAADDYGPWFTYAKNADCQGCRPGLKGCLCGVEYPAYRMRKEPRPYCSCEAISSRAANPLLGNTPNLYGYCIMGDRNVHCGHRGALELEARADPVTMKTSPPRDLPDSIKWDPKLYVGNDPEILAQVERELAEQENASSV